jgi:hypothetical protein
MDDYFKSQTLYNQKDMRLACTKGKGEEPGHDKSRVMTMWIRYGHICNWDLSGWGQRGQCL